MSKLVKKKIAVVCIELVIAGIFVSRVGAVIPSLRLLYHSYFADVVIPFGFYFLLSINEDTVSILRHWWAKAVAIFTLCAASETLQFFGIYALARVFDPVDYVMYGVGVLLAAFFDRQFFSRIFEFWDLESQ